MRWLRWRKRRVKGRKGAVTVEFALAIVPFLIMVLGIVEVGLVSYSSATLRNGVFETARVIRTNSQGCKTNAQIKEMICRNTLFAPGCETNLEVSRNVLDEGWGSDTISGGGSGDETASGGDVVVVEATYTWRNLSPLLKGIVGDDEGKLRFAQRFVFQTEPFGPVTC